MLSINLYAQSDKGVLVIYRDYQLQGQGLKYPVMINDSAVVMMKVGTPFNYQDLKPLKARKTRK